MYNQNTSSTTTSPTEFMRLLSIRQLTRELAFSIVATYSEHRALLWRGGMDPLEAAYSSTAKSSSTAKELRPRTFNQAISSFIISLQSK